MALWPTSLHNLCALYAWADPFPSCIQASNHIISDDWNSYVGTAQGDEPQALNHPDSICLDRFPFPKSTIWTTVRSSIRDTLWDFHFRCMSSGNQRQLERRQHKQNRLGCLLPKSLHQVLNWVANSLILSFLKFILA
jgi:hypothetical protein